MTNTKELTEKVYDILNNLGGLNVTLSQPEASMTFPVIVIAPPTESGYPHQQYTILHFNIEAWDDTRYKVMQTFDKIKVALCNNDINLRNSTNIYQDLITQKYRISGSFECRYNHITNKIEQNF